MHYETFMRSILKAASWRLGASVATVVLVFIFTKQIALAVAVGGIEMVLKMLLYFLHERVWNKLKFGKKEAKPFVLWFSGLPYSGKTTVADEVCNYLKKNHLKVERLDSKNVRALFPETGFSKQEVNLHIKRVGHLAKTLETNGIIVVASFVSPYRESRDFVRSLCKEFVQVYTQASIDVCRKRHEDINSAQNRNKLFPEQVFRVYEKPLDCDILLDTQRMGIKECRQRVLQDIKKRYLK